MAKNNTMWIGIAVIVIVAIAFFVLRGGDDGPTDVVIEDVAPVPANEDEQPEMEADEFVEMPAVEGCTDSDGGLNYAVAGTVVDGSLTEDDTCSGNSVLAGRLYEEYCDENGRHARMKYDCPSGSCVDGACA
jgi:hypothetical protein